ncbi:MAG: hypothetical protein Q7J57_18055 [Gemmobacter sp.]|nr:hypothetical protein [Gemmobacter sp.]
MKRIVPLREIASARAADTGNVSNVAVWAYSPRDYPAIKAQVTAERVKAHMVGLAKGKVERFELDALGCLNFVMQDALEGGVRQSLNLDADGKSFSFLILSIDVEIVVEQ